MHSSSMRDHRSLEAWKEAQAVANSPSFTHHLTIAYGSAVETGELLKLALDTEVVSADLAKQLLERNQRCQRLLLGLLKWRRGL
jgi:four helix bundle protein